MSNIVTPEFRVSFPFIFKSQLNKLSGKEEYSLVALFPKNADLSVLKAAVQAAAKEKWGADVSKWPFKPETLKNPLRDQGERAKYVDGKEVLPQGHEKGAIFINLKSTQRPGLVDQNVQDILDPSQFYAGCWARATVSAYAYDQKGNRGVSLGLRNVQKTRDGDPFGGRSRPQDDFAPIAGANTGSATDLFS